jgi:hypothetical protein
VTGNPDGCANLTRRIGRFLAMVAQLRNLLFALLVTVVALPDGFTVCLRQLGGVGIERGCCATCRTRESDERGQPAVTANRCAHCCLSVPATARKLDLAPKKPVRSDLPPLAAFVFTSVEPSPALSRLAVRAESRRPRPPVPIAVPLRI